MFDFTIKTYKLLIRSIPPETPMTVSQFFIRPRERAVLLRHDVDAFPENSLRFARIQQKLGIHGTYYFRIIPKSYHPVIMERIAEMGHEIGYHYEDVDLASKMLRKKEFGDDGQSLIDLAYEKFTANLTLFRRNFDVSTICSHGSPFSKYDNKIMWKKYDYRKLGILGESGLDLDFKKFGYLSDTGRRWNGGNVSLRDKIQNSIRLNCRSTFDVMRSMENKELPNQMLMNFHPQRWNDDRFRWALELVKQNTKNTVKYFIILNKRRMN